MPRRQGPPEISMVKIGGVRVRLWTVKNIERARRLSLRSNPAAKGSSETPHIWTLEL